MSRALPEWTGKTDDAKVPPRVRLRVFEAHGGRCWISGRKIMPGEAWELDHKVALINGGSHSEDNLAPALVGPHREKTAEDVALKSKVYRIKAKHQGTWPAPARRMQSRPFPKRNNEGAGR